LCFAGNIRMDAPSALEPILKNLELIWMNGTQHSAVLKILPHLTTKCTNLAICSMEENELNDLIVANRSNLTQVTCLSLTDIENIHFLHKLCDHFLSLQKLEFDLSPYHIRDLETDFQLNSYTINQLAKLTQLDQLKLYG